MHLTFTKLPFLVLVFFLLPVFCLANETFPSFPMAFWGNATVDNDPLPAGTIIRAYCDNDLVGEITMAEDEIYGYTTTTKNKLLVTNCDGDILFKYLPQGAEEDLTGGVEVKYTEGFVSGITVHKNLNFITIQPSPGGIPSGGGGGTPSTPLTPETTIGEVTITVSTGGKAIAISPENTKASVEIPANTVSDSTEIKITPVTKSSALTTTEKAPTGKSIIGNYIYNFTAVSEGTAVATFLKPITLTFTYTNEQVKGLNESSLKIHYWKESDSKWVDLDTNVDTKNNTLTATVTHFTLFAVMGTKGDMNGDGKIDFDDFAAFALLYKKTYTNFDKKVENIPISWGDFDSDGDVDFDDFAAFALSYGK